MVKDVLITKPLDSAFRAVRMGEAPVSQEDVFKGDRQIFSLNYPSPEQAHTGSGLVKNATTGVVYGQPMFFSPVHTPINWQIPSKRKEVYQWCVTPWTGVLLADFTKKPIHKCAVGDKVISHTGIARKIAKVMTRDVDENIYELEIQAEEEPLRITGNHTVYAVKKENICCRYKLRNKAPQKCTILFHDKCSTVKSDKPSCSIKDLKIEDVKIEDLKRGDYLVCPVPSLVSKDKSDIGINKARLLGYYAAEGNVCINQSKSIYQVQFTLNIDEKETLAKEITKLFKEEFDVNIHSYNYLDRPNTLILKGQSREAVTFFSTYCKGKAPAKKLKESVMSWSVELQKHLVACYLLGDGHVKTKKGSILEVSISSASLDLLNQTKYMISRMGYGTAKIGKKRTELKGKIFTSYYLAFSKSTMSVLRDVIKHVSIPVYNKVTRNSCLVVNGFVVKRLNRITKRSYKGPVYNLEVEKDHSYIVEGVAVHNCRFYYENEPKVASAIDFYCFTPDAQIQTQHGKIKRISSVSAGELIIAGDGSRRRVLRKYERYAEEELLELKIAGLTTFPIKCTHGHEILVADKDGQPRFIQACQIQTGQYLMTPCPKAGDVDADSDLAWLLGLYAADGCSIPYEHERNDGKFVKDYKGVYFGLHITETWIAEHIREIVLEKFGCSKVSIRKNEEQNLLLISVYSRDVADFLIGLCPGKSKLGTKRFSPILNNWKEFPLHNLISGFMSGDGCFNPKNGLQGVGVCRELMFQISHFLDILKIPHSITMQRPKVCKEERKRQTIYNVRISRKYCEEFAYSCCQIANRWTENLDLTKANNEPYFYRNCYIWRKVLAIEKFNYAGPVYDLEIEGEHSYTVNKVVVHNSLFPINGFTLETKDRYVRHFYDRLCRNLNLEKKLRVMSHESYLLGDCFPFLEISCPICGGSGRSSGGKCNHEEGTFKRLVVLNPDYVEVYTNPIEQEGIIALIPDEELRSLVIKKMPGHEKLSPTVVQYIIAGKPIPLDNANVSHIKFGESGYNRYGTSLVRRLFQTLAYKTKLMTAQWIVAERLILPIKIVKVGNEDRPAGPQDLGNVQAQLAQVANDPNLTLVTHHAIDFEYFGAAGKVLQLSNEFELIAQEILDGLMINKALLNGEGPTYSNAAIGIEAMIDRLEAWRGELKHWVEEKIFLPIAKMQGFVSVNEWGEKEYVYPKLKWNIMHLRDQQQYRQFIIQLYEKGLVSGRRVLETFDIDPDEEIEMTRYERSLNVGMPAPGGGAPGGMGGGFGGGAPGGMGGGMPPLGGPEEGGGMPMPGGEGGLPTGGAPMPKTDQLADISRFEGKVLKEKTRDKILKQREKLLNQQQKVKKKKDKSGFMRDEQGRVMFTEIERELLKELVQRKNTGKIRYAIQCQFEVMARGQAYTIDFAFPQIKLGVEVDGAMWHSDPDQIKRDQERDEKLVNEGWTILRFTDSEIESRLTQVVETVMTYIVKKEAMLKKFEKQRNAS